jgi:hypothetical protein
MPGCPEEWFSVDGLLRLPEITERAGIFEISARFLLGPWRWLPNDGSGIAFGHTGGHTPDDANVCLLGTHCDPLVAVKNFAWDTRKT